MNMQENPVVEQGEIVEMDDSWKVQVLAIGAVLGALTGLGAAYLLVQRAKKRGESPSLSALEGVKLGVLIFGLLRQVSMLGGNDEK
jgi:ABC-type Fe3+-siderophore transport system permease subunit